jgi:hypothetical protein
MIVAHRPPERRWLTVVAQSNTSTALEGQAPWTTVIEDFA